MNAMMGHLQRELEKLKKRILALGAAVEGRVQASVRAVERLDAEKAKWVVDADHEIDETEVEVEEECLKLLALYQPVAVDLRFIACVIKINNDLERIGDEAVNIARRVLDMVRDAGPGDQCSFDVRSLGEKSLAMLQQSLDALVHLDTDLAYRVLATDDDVDSLYWQSARGLIEEMKAGPGRVEFLLSQVFVARHLERIGDHATNIAEEVIHLVQGEVIRHRAFRERRKPPPETPLV